MWRLTTITHSLFLLCSGPACWAELYWVSKMKNKKYHTVLKHSFFLFESLISACGDVYMIQLYLIFSGYICFLHLWLNIKSFRAFIFSNSADGKYLIVNYHIIFYMNKLIFLQPINSSQSKEAVFRVPVAGASFLHKNTLPGIVPTSRTVSQAAFGVLVSVTEKNNVCFRLTNQPKYITADPNYRILRTIGRYFFPSTCWLRPIVHIDLYKDEVKKILNP